MTATDLQLDLELELERMSADVTALNRTGMALMMERDHDTLLRQIVDAAMRVTCSDAGALYLLDKSNGAPRLRFKVARSESVSTLPQVADMSFAVDETTLVGHAALTREPLVSDDVHDLPADVPYQHSLFVEELLGYRAKSMITIPMVDHRDAVVGVLQLANRKRDALDRIASAADVDRQVIPYSRWDTQLAFSLAGQAAVSIENANLYRQVEDIFESFTKAAVTALEQRDPGTSGHSIRVATLVIDLAQALERTSTGPYHNLRFTSNQIRELRYAALLHDFGKVAVREEVLGKAKKLPPLLWERITARFELIRCALALEHAHRRTELVSSHSSRTSLTALDADLQEQLQQVRRFESAIGAANEPEPLAAPRAAMLMDIARQTFQRPDGRLESYLTAEELGYLQIPSGSLDERERLEVEAHAGETLRFLSHIPWTESLQNVPVYAAGHHEKLDGTGYPMHLTAAGIPVQTRIMTIADIFDALTASDRPYKRAIGADQAFDILRSEATAGSVDGEIVRVLIESQVYRHVLEQDWRHL